MHSSIFSQYCGTFHIVIGRLGLRLCSKFASGHLECGARLENAPRSSLGRMPTQPDWPTPFLFRLIHLATVAGPSNTHICDHVSNQRFVKPYCYYNSFLYTFPSIICRNNKKEYILISTTIVCLLERTEDSKSILNLVAFIKNVVELQHNWTRMRVRY